MINWKIRLRNRTFWTALIPALLLLAQNIAAVFGLELDFGTLGTRILAAVNQIFIVLTILGIVVDPTTAGVADSERAMGYERAG